MNRSPDMFIDTPLSPPPPPVVVAITSLRSIEKSISSTVNAILLVDYDQVSNEYIISCSTGRGRGRERVCWFGTWSPTKSVVVFTVEAIESSFLLEFVETTTAEGREGMVNY